MPLPDQNVVSVNATDKSYFDAGMQTILSCIAKLECKVDRIEQRLKDMQLEKRSKKTVYEDDDDSKTFKKLAVPADLNSFEEKLASDKEFKINVVRVLLYAFKIS